MRARDASTLESQRRTIGRHVSTCRQIKSPQRADRTAESITDGNGPTCKPSITDGDGTPLGASAHAVGNARAFLAIQAEHGSYDAWLWAQAKAFPAKRDRMATTSPLAEHLATELRRRGMKFVGPSIMHATLQAIGVYQDHLPGCWKYGRK